MKVLWCDDESENERQRRLFLSEWHIDSDQLICVTDDGGAIDALESDGEICLVVMDLLWNDQIDHPDMMPMGIKYLKQIRRRFPTVAVVSRSKVKRIESLSAWLQDLVDLGVSQHFASFDQNDAADLRRRLVIQTLEQSENHVAGSGTSKRSTSKVQSGKPTCFIGSSTKGLLIGQYLQDGLKDYLNCTIWNQGVFGLSKGTLESLEDASQNFDFAILVVTPDDLVYKKRRNRGASAPRDNVVFEMGFFMGSLGRRKTFLVCERADKLDLPSDLAGIVLAMFSTDEDKSLSTSIAEPCLRIKEAIDELHRD